MDETAAVTVGFDAYTEFRVCKCTVFNREIFYTTLSWTSNGYTMTKSKSTICYQHIRCITATSEVIIAHTHIATLNQYF